MSPVLLTSPRHGRGGPSSPQAFSIDQPNEFAGCGYLSSSFAPFSLGADPASGGFRAIRAAARGDSVLAPAVAARIMTRMRAPAEESLSAREIEVLQLVAKGASNKEIGKSLHISTATVKTHLIHIYGKLGVDDRTAAVTTALEKGIITLER